METIMIFVYAFWIAVVLIFGCAFFISITSYTEMENHCASLGQELDGWRINAVQCRGVEDGYVVISPFQKVNGAWYPVKE